MTTHYNNWWIVLLSTPELLAVMKSEQWEVEFLITNMPGYENSHERISSILLISECAYELARRGVPDYSELNAR